MRRAWTGVVLACLAPAAWAQEPIFVTPPVTMFQQGGLVGVEIERQGGTVVTSSEAAFGILPPWTVALHGVGVDARGAPLELARLHLGTRVRLVKVDRPREWILFSVYGAGALPLGDEAARVARVHGVPDLVLGLSAARMARRGDAFADLSWSRTAGPAGTRSGAALGVAVGWRPAPGDYGKLEAQLFAEARGQYQEGGAAAIGLASGILVHSRNMLLKVGVLFPAWTRRTSDEPVVRLGAKLLL